MKYCEALNGSLNIERDRVHFCVAVKQNMPTIPWNPDEDLPLDKIKIVRDALVKGLNENIDSSVEEYEKYGTPVANPGHPCKGCRYIQEIDDACELPSTDQLNCYLHMQAFTYCNAKCIYCNLRMDEGKTPLSRGKDLDHSVYKVVRQMLGANAIAPTCRIIFSSGEPSLSKEGMGVLTDITRMGFNTLINTNAIHFAPEIEDALKFGKTHVQLSLESGDRESYLAIKGVDEFDSVVKNVDRYLGAVRGNSVFWIKYIIFSETNTKKNMDKFIEFCRDHHIPNVVVSANYNEGEAVSLNCLGKGVENEEENADFESLKAFGYLTTRLELLGVNVHKEFAQLTKSEQALAKAEYARSVMDVLEYAPDDETSCIKRIAKGLDLASLPEENPHLRAHMYSLLNNAANDSKGIALFGAGVHARWIHGLMQDIGLKPAVAFDNNPEETSTFEISVVKPAEISRYDIDTVIIASNAYHFPIYAQLSKMPEFKEIRIIDPYLDI